MEAQQKTTPKASILVVDDTPDYQHLLRSVLAGRGYEVQVAPDGTSALRSVRSALPDLVLLDIMMPDMDGYAVCERLKADERTRDIPVIFLSALGKTLDKVKAFSVGGVDYVTKPFQAEEVLARVETHLALRDTQKRLAERNARLEQEIAERRRAEAAERSARELAETRAAELNILRGVVETLNQAVSLQEAIRSGLETIQTTLGAQAGWIVLVDEHGAIRLETTRDLQPTLWSKHDAEIPCSSCHHLKRLLAGELPGPALNAECSVLESVQRDAREPADSVIVVPLRLGERTLGALLLVIGSKVILTEDERRLLAIIGDQYSAAVERARLFDRVQQLAITDSLTGLFTRRHFWALTRQEFEQADRLRYPVSIIMLDVDHFKQINDQYGHIAGDQVLQAAAGQCRKSLRQADVLARYGGDEFEILLPKIGNAEAQHVAERLRQQIAATPIDTDGGRLSITVSLGVASREWEEDLAPEKLIGRADQALYVAKREGRNRVVVWAE